MCLGDDVGGPEDEDSPQLLRTRSDASFMQIQRRSKTHSSRDLQRLRTHRFSINGHFYNHKVSWTAGTFRTSTLFLLLMHLQVQRGGRFLLYCGIVLLYLSFATACCELDLLTCLTAQGYKVTLQVLQFMSVDIEMIQAGRISLLFYSSCSKCPKCSNPGMPKIGVTSVHKVPSTFCPLCHGFLMFICLPPDICIYSSLWFSH